VELLKKRSDTSEGFFVWAILYKGPIKSPTIVLPFYKIAYTENPLQCKVPFFRFCFVQGFFPKKHLILLRGFACGLFCF